MPKKYTDKFLISELQRFVLDNSRSPRAIDMQSKSGYPSYAAYTNHFGSWNKALLSAELEINVIKERLIGDEVCDKCSKLNSFNQGWSYKNNQRLCFNCYQKTLKNYMNGKLDPDSTVGFGFIGQRVVAKALGLELKYDCNCSMGFNAPYDLYDETLGKIEVKSATLGEDNHWGFSLIYKDILVTYILLAFSRDKSDIEHVWIEKNSGVLISKNQNVKDRKGINITNTYDSLKFAEPWETNVKPFNDAYHSMSLENCKVLRSD